MLHSELKANWCYFKDPGSRHSSQKQKKPVSFELLNCGILRTGFSRARLSLSGRVFAYDLLGPRFDSQHHIQPHLLLSASYEHRTFSPCLYMGHC